MPEAGLGSKISLWFYRLGIGVAKPDFVKLIDFGNPEWFKLANILIKDNNLQGRKLILDEILQSRHLKSHPKRGEFLAMLGRFLTKGILDERRRIIRYIDENPSLFHSQDDAIFGPLITAQRDSDTIIANAAESAVTKIKGQAPDRFH